MKIVRERERERYLNGVFEEKIVVGSPRRRTVHDGDGDGKDLFGN
jgi:hypothetical protein